MVDRSKNSILGSIDKLIKYLPLKALKTFTSDIGKQFDCNEDVEKRSINFYFADAYSEWKRGSNENNNGLLRKYYPKKTNLSGISVNELIKNLMEINSRPRKCLGYQTSLDLFMHELSSL